MLSIRLQRVGRKGHALYRLIVQDSHRQPTSGKIVAQLGSYNPHSKEVVLDKEKAQKFLDNGAQPTPRVVSLFKTEKIKLPKWVEELDKKQKKAIRNPEKLRRNQPAEEKPANLSAEASAKVEEPKAEEAAPESSDEAAQAPVEAEAPTVEEADKSVEQIAEAEVEEGQVTAEEEVADSANEDSEQNASEDIPSEEKTEKA